MPIEPQQPAGYQPNPVMPPGPEPLVMEAFDGMNTVALRPGVPDKQCAWIDGFMPVAPRNLRTLCGIGTGIYNAPAGKTISFYTFYNISSNYYAAVFLSDGSVVQLNTTDGVTIEILPAGTIQDPSITNCGTSQYGSTYLLIVANQTDGYWIWDGSVVYGAGTISPIFDITDAGAGYSSSPSVVVSGGSGTGIAVAATVSGGFVTGLNVITPGSGYLAGDVLTLTFIGGQSSGTGANLTANMTTAAGGSGASLTAVAGAGQHGGFGITSVTVNNGGAGYSPFTTYGFSGPSAYFITPVLQLHITGGVITSVTVVDTGASTTSQVPTVNVNDSGNTYVSSVTINAGGSGYSPSTVALASGGTTPVVQATFGLTINSSGVITAVAVTGPGSYAGGTPTITVTDTPATATATAMLMPFGLSGTTVETYSGHVWIAKGATIFFSAPGSVVDFSAGSGGGNTVASDSTLRIQYTRLINANGFLWLFGDCSLSYISGVTTSGSPITTTFTIQNADPDTGTSWPATVGTFGRDLTFANFWGAHTSKGSLTTKTSEMLDGVYNSVIPGTFQRAPFTFQPSAAKAVIFGRKVWMMLIPIINPLTQVQQDKLFLWDGKRWWASSQNTDVVYIQCQEINSLPTAWGTNGNIIFPLFNTPSSSFSKTVQSKLWDVGGYWLANATTRFWAMFKYYVSALASVVLTIDNENYPLNSETLTISETVLPSGVTILRPTAVAQQGVLAGFTLSTNAADMSIISTALKPEITQYRG